MSNYTQNTFFANKDNLATGNANKKILGSEVDAEFAEIATAVASKTEGQIPSGTRMVVVQGSVLLLEDTESQGGDTAGNWTLNINGSVTLPNHAHSAGNYVTDNGSGNFAALSDSGNDHGVGTHTHLINGNSGNPNSLPSSNVSFGGNFANALPNGAWRPSYAKSLVCSKD